MVSEVAKLLHICAVIMYHAYLFKNFVVQFVSNTVLCLSYKYFFLPLFCFNGLSEVFNPLWFHITVSPPQKERKKYRDTQNETRNPSDHIPHLFQTEFVLKKIKYFFPMEKSAFQVFSFPFIGFLVYCLFIFSLCFPCFCSALSLFLFGICLCAPSLGCAHHVLFFTHCGISNSAP